MRQEVREACFEKGSISVIANYFTRIDVKFENFRMINRTKILLGDRRDQANLKTNLSEIRSVPIKRFDVGMPISHGHSPHRS